MRDSQRAAQQKARTTYLVDMWPQRIAADDCQLAKRRCSHHAATSTPTRHDTFVNKLSLRSLFSSLKAAQRTKHARCYARHAVSQLIRKHARHKIERSWHTQPPNTNEPLATVHAESAPRRAESIGAQIYAIRRSITVRNTTATRTRRHNGAKRTESSGRAIWRPPLCSTNRPTARARCAHANVTNKQNREAQSVGALQSARRHTSYVSSWIKILRSAGMT